jgi:hypothetical protein
MVFQSSRSDGTRKDSDEGAPPSKWQSEDIERAKRLATQTDEEI